MTLVELHALLGRLGVELTARGDRLHYKAPAGVMTPEIRDALTAHKPRLLALLAGVNDQVRPDGPPAVEPARPAGSTDRGPPPADRHWRRIVALWPIDWRERWGRRANELEDCGDTWNMAEWVAFQEVSRDLAEARGRGEVAYAPPVPGLSDAEAIAGIALAFGECDPAAVGPADRGPRDFRRGDRWLPRHHSDGPADDYDREERAAMYEFDAGMTREQAERAVGLRPRRGGEA
jgi:hypothetical protein